MAAPHFRYTPPTLHTHITPCTPLARSKHPPFTPHQHAVHTIFSRDTAPNVMQAALTALAGDRGERGLPPAPPPSHPPTMHSLWPWGRPGAAAATAASALAPSAFEASSEATWGSGQLSRVLGLLSRTRCSRFESPCGRPTWRTTRRSSRARRRSAPVTWTARTSPGPHQEAAPEWCERVVGGQGGGVPWGDGWRGQKGRRVRRAGHLHRCLLGEEGLVALVMLQLGAALGRQRSTLLEHSGYLLWAMGAPWTLGDPTGTN